MDKLNTKEIPSPYFNSKLQYFINEIKDFIKDKKRLFIYYGSIIISYPLELIAFSYVTYIINKSKQIDIKLLIKNIVTFFILYGLVNLTKIIRII